MTSKSWPTGIRLGSGSVLLLLLVAGFLLYGKTFGHAWSYDDYPVIVENTDVRSLANFFDNRYPGRPLRELTFLLDYQFFALAPAGFHLQNILWHSLNAWLVFLFGTTLGLTRLWAALAALLFLIHPLNVEVVAQTSHRKDSLALFFGLTALLSWRRFLLEEPRRYRWLTATLLAAGVALLAKEHAVLLPLIGLAFALFGVPVERAPFRPSGKVLFCTAATLLGVAVGRIVYLCYDQNFLTAVRAALAKLADTSTVSVATYYLTILKAQTFLFAKWLWPLDLAPEYTFAVPKGMFDPWVVAGIALLLAFFALLAWSWNRAPVVAFLLIWIVVGWLPTSNYFGYFSYFAADRYLYFSSAGLAVLSVRLVSTGNARYCVPLTVLGLAVLWGVTTRQIEVWRSPTTLSAQIVKVNPASLEGRIGQVDEAIKASRLAEAETELRRLLVAYPQDGKLYNLYARLLFRQERIDAAIAMAEKGVLFNPADAEGFNNLGTYLAFAKQPERAVENFRQALRLNPNDERYHAGLGKLYEDLGDWTAAEASYREAIRCLPSYAPAHYNLGVVLYRRGEKGGAIEAFRRAGTLRPDDADALFNQGAVAVELGRFAEAEEVAARLQPLAPERSKELRSEILRAKAAGNR